MHLTTSYSLFRTRWTWTLPRVVNTYFLRNALRAKSQYTTEGMLSWQYSVRDHHDPAILGDVSETMSKFADVVETTYEESAGREMAKCYERDVKAYYVLYRPVEREPFYVRIENPNYTQQTNKIAEVDFDEYNAYYSSKVGNAVFTTVGCVFLAGTAWYMYRSWKNDFSFVDSLVHFALYTACASFILMPDPVDAYVFLAAICGPNLAVVTWKSIKTVDKDNAGALVVANTVLLPLVYFLFRKSFQSMFGRALFAGAWATVLSTTYLLKQSNKKI